MIGMDNVCYGQSLDDRYDNGVLMDAIMESECSWSTYLYG